MAYKNGKTYVSRRHSAIRKFIKDKNVEGLLWVILQDCFEDMEESKTPRYGKTMLTFVIQQLAVIENKKTYKGKTGSQIEGTSVRSEDIIKKWLSIREEDENEEEEHSHSEE